MNVLNVRNFSFSMCTGCLKNPPNIPMPFVTYESFIADELFVSLRQTER